MSLTDHHAAVATIRPGDTLLIICADDYIPEEKEVAHIRSLLPDGSKALFLSPDFRAVVITS